MYVSICLSNDNNTMDKFLSIKDAEKYIEKFCCSQCLIDLENGKMDETFEDDNGVMDKYTIEINDILDTSCGAEWLILKEEDYQKCNNMVDILEYAGYKQVNK
jgi:hypothetical protein